MNEARLCFRGALCIFFVLLKDGGGDALLLPWPFFLPSPTLPYPPPPPPAYRAHCLPERLERLALLLLGYWLLTLLLLSTASTFVLVNKYVCTSQQELLYLTILRISQVRAEHLIAASSLPLQRRR